MTVAKTDADRPPGQVEIIAAVPDDEPVFSNLLELYAHDFSEFHNVELGADGRFGYKQLPLYWREPNRYPFLVKVGGKLAGFVLVKQGSELSKNDAIWDMAEFFVVRGYRRRGIGTDIAHQVWRRFPGRWEVRVMQSNRLAHRFWARAIMLFAGHAIHSAPIEKNERCWHVFSFESGHAAQHR